jgi:hypothetical protein
MVASHYRDTSGVQLTIQFPWRHALPQSSRVLDTFAFRASDLACIDMASGPLTDIAVLDGQDAGANETAMQPPVFVECLSDPAGRPFRFVTKTIH